MITQNTFTGGMIMDLNPLTTPNTVLTDALNATIITYDGEEFILQNDKGNCKVERAKLSVGFIPVGMQEDSGIIYVASYNPETNQSELGAFPSPERDFSTTDFEDLTPVKFQTNQFVMDTGANQQEKSTVIGKLIDPELLQLNPGDMYVVVFNTNGGPTNGVMPINQYISSDVLDRKLFKLKFYKITDENNLSDLNPDDVKLIQDSADIENEYVPFKENSKGTIAVGLELETLDLFDINVIDTSKRTDELKSAVIEAVGYSNSLADFKGVRLQTTEPVNSTYFIEKSGNGKKVSAKLTELAANARVVGTVTPYSTYGLYPKLSRDFNLELGKYASTESGINNIFKYYVNGNYMKLDFDFKFEGDSSNGLQLYVEFYDPWSDYSVIKVVDDPTYYGVNSVQIELVNEPRVEVFNISTSGGTPTSFLITNPDTNYQKTLLNSTNLIRTNSTLRKDHFYIVRVSGVDVTYEGDVANYKHYDFYKGLYTNDFLNSLYTQQNLIQPNDPNIVSDFNAIDFKIEDLVKYNTNIVNNKPNFVKSKLLNYEDGVLSTNNKYYSISDELLSGGYYRSGYNYTKEINTDLTFSLNTSKYIFGTFKEELAKIELPNVDIDAGPIVSNVLPTIDDIGYNIIDTNINPNSEAKIEIKKINDEAFRIKKSLSTNRWVYAEKVLHSNTTGDPIQKSVVDHVKVDKRFAAMNTAMIEFTGKRITFGSSAYNTCKTDKFDGPKAKTIIDAKYPSQYPAVIFAKGTSLFFSDISNSCQYNTYGLKDPRMVVVFDDGVRWDGQELALMRDVDGYYATQITSDSRYILGLAFPELRVYSQVKITVFVYYPDFDNVINNDLVTTNAEFKNLYYNVVYAPIGGKTYLSEFYFRAQNATTDFSATTINNYIATRKSDSVIVDDKDAINDGFIPYISSNYTAKNELPIDILSVSEQAPSNIIDEFKDAHNNWQDDDAFIESQQYVHGQVYSRKPEFDDIAKLFKVHQLGVSTAPITEDNFELRANYNNNYTNGSWKAVHYRVNYKILDDEKNPTKRLNIKINN